MLTTLLNYKEITVNFKNSSQDEDISVDLNVFEPDHYSSLYLKMRESLEEKIENELENNWIFEKFNKYCSEVVYMVVHRKFGITRLERITKSFDIKIEAESALNFLSDISVPDLTGIWEVILKIKNEKR